MKKNNSILSARRTMRLLPMGTYSFSFTLTHATAVVVIAPTQRNTSWQSVGYSSGKLSDLRGALTKSGKES